VQTSDPADQFWTQDSLGVQDEAEANDHLGFEDVAGDYNGDGFVDLAMSVYFEDVFTNRDVREAGAVAVLYTGPDGVQADAPDDQFWTQNSPGLIGDVKADDKFGLVLE
jgi:hypothetical protein